MTRKKKPAGEVDESKLVRVPEIAPEGAPFAEVAYEHRCHREPHECCGVTFEPGHVLTFRTPADVPEAMRDDPKLQVHGAAMGACRLQATFRYTPMTGPEFNVLAAQAEAAKAEPDESVGAPPMDTVALNDGATEPEGGE